MSYTYPLLYKMLADMESAPALYRPTQFWCQAVGRIVEDARSLGMECFRRWPSALSYFVPTYSFPGWKENPQLYDSVLSAFHALQLKDARPERLLRGLMAGEAQAYADYRVYLASHEGGPLHSDRASESACGNPIEQFTFGKASFSRSSLNYLLGLCFLKEMIPAENIQTVMEIGGGFGSLGEVILSDARNRAFYVNVDIPPTAFVSTWYLQQVFGVEQVGSYDVLCREKVLDLEGLRRRYRAVVLCPWQLDHLRGQMDLFVNFISFQEMEPDVVQNYCGHVDRLQAKHVLLRNLREGKQKAAVADAVGVREPVKADDYDRFFPNYRLLAANTEPFGFKTADGFHSELRLYSRNRSGANAGGHA